MSAPPPDFRWLPEALTPAEADAALAALVDETPWESHTFSIFGRTVAMPRRIAFYGRFPYAYSGLVHPARPLTPRLDALRERVEALSGHPFNCVLLNLYRDGHYAMGWHSDDDYPHGGHPAVASLNLGATRRFRVQAKRGPKSLTARSGPSGAPVGASRPRREAEGRLEVSRAPRNAGIGVPNGAPRRGGSRGEAPEPRAGFGLDLTHGGLLVMEGRSQQDWRHSVPRTARPVGVRVNLTFRHMAGPNG
ncbi:MAG: alpha-ketoglutarate-dependent dioxygenase AlkB [Myxococcales bacterium]|nr:alpha-ketoglutarate-dependent dioxygenase AlkB [Myxococcales bacterium]